jgi:hypothetical protein
MTDYWSALKSVIEERGFEPSMNQDGQRSSRGEQLAKRGPVSLFRAVRLALGVEESALDFADVSFWNWMELRSFLLSVWSALDTQIQRDFQSTSPAIVWASRAERTQSEVLGLIERASSQGDVISAPDAALRPIAFQMVGMGKIDAAIVNTCAVLTANLDLSYGDLLSQLVEFGGTDEELLTFLDRRVSSSRVDRTVSDQSSLIPRELVRAKIAIVDKMNLASINFVKFLQVLDESNNLDNITDESLLVRLIRIAPEPKSSAIAKKLIAAGVQHD